MLGAVLMAVMMAVTFSACGNDDDEDDDFIGGGSSSRDSALVGTWKWVEEDDGWKETEVYKFKSDGTFEESYTGVYEGETEKSWVKGKWETVEGVLFMTVKSFGGDLDDEVHEGMRVGVPYSVNGKKLSFYYDDDDIVIYTKQ